jgi:DNA-binding GntR family transcriptional regulator
LTDTGVRPTKHASKRTVVENLVLELRRQIVHESLGANERLTEVKLAQSNDVSRNTVREALLRLADNGFVVGEPHKGYTVRHFAADDIRGIGEVFATLEVAAIRNTSFPVSSSTTDVMFDAASSMARLELWDDVDRLCELDRIFHGALVGASGRPWIIDAWRRQGPLLNAMVVPMLRHKPVHNGIQQCTRHLELLNFVVEGAAADLESKLLEHYYQ